MTRVPHPLERQLRRHAYRRSDREIVSALAWTAGLALAIRLALLLTPLSGRRAHVWAVLAAAAAVVLYHAVRPLLNDLRELRRARRDRDAAGEDRDRAV